MEFVRSWSDGYMWEKAISNLAGNLNSGHSYLITAECVRPNNTGYLFSDQKVFFFKTFDAKY